MAAYARREARTESFMAYIAESVRVLPQGMSMRVPWHELQHPKPDYDADEVVRGVVERLGLEVI